MMIHETAALARKAFYSLSITTAETRNKALCKIAETLDVHREDIFKANRLDLEEAKSSNLSSPLLSRLVLGNQKLDQVIQGLYSLAKLDDPLGKTTLSREISPGLDLYCVTCPIGVIGVIFESRPDALVQITSLCLKSGNAVLLKGGHEALQTNRMLRKLIRDSVIQVGIDSDFIQLLETRDDVSHMLKEDEYIDLIIPRGSRDFVRYIMNNSNIPVLGHADGLCHVYIDQYADLDMALNIAIDSKVQNVSVCNAEETLLVHSSIACHFLPAFSEMASHYNLTIVGDDKVCEMVHCEAATEEDWKTEYLDLKLSVKIVDSLQEAVNHINQYGSHHTDCIVTSSKESAAVFMSSVDSAGVYWNASTRFADGFVYGFGAQVGIATGKIHARGPMGMNGLITYKYKLIGHGQTMGSVKSGKIYYTHKDTNQTCLV